jgi:hypothetical protein
MFPASVTQHQLHKSSTPCNLFRLLHKWLDHFLPHSAEALFKIGHIVYAPEYVRFVVWITA